MPVVLSCQNLSKSFTHRPLFSDITLSFDDSERVGLIGPNGAGKSTLLKILAGLESSDDGSVSKRRDLQAMYLAQQDPELPEGMTIRHAIEDAFTGDPSEKVSAVGATIGQCGFSDPDLLVESLSGGWKKRVALARLLVNSPDFLLLDEPTNHLDFAGIEWCERFLNRYQGGVIVISHDRTFLQNVCTRIVEISPRYPDGHYSYSGTYADFLEKREEYLNQLGQQMDRLANRVRREVEWLRQGVKARTTKSGARIKEAERMIGELREMGDRSSIAERSTIAFDATGRKTKDLLLIEEGEKSLGGRTLFKNLSMKLAPGMKLGIVGPNGSGKSTLLKIIASQEELTEGKITRAPGLRISYFDQHKLNIGQDVTLRYALSPDGQSVVYQNEQMHIVSWAKRFLFRVDQLDTRVEELSGGERSRVLLARLMSTPADLLILDEPTNDLDIPTLEVLEESLEEFQGAVAVVTHDRYLLSNVATHIVGLDGAGGAHAMADFAQWEEFFKQFERNRQSPAQKNKGQPQERVRETKVKLSYQEQKELSVMEEKILEAEGEVERYQSECQKPDVFSDPLKMQEVSDKLHQAERAVEALYKRWEELEAKRAEAERR